MLKMFIVKLCKTVFITKTSRDEALSPEPFHKLVEMTLIKIPRNHHEDATTQKDGHVGGDEGPTCNGGDGDDGGVDAQGLQDTSEEKKTHPQLSNVFIIQTHAKQFGKRKTHYLPLLISSYHA